ncbi:HAMP domain-containing sensor histidine kinase [Dactylosporangium sp. NBC_01737]|uniref:sensor histidine kinase n=1 Tax=Dactylosporangium sp. NBC_01737 TaxID=2975959 RepID=UPI002E0FB842|nr:HAMP domain-containing sensor histidine kinase [Dactylosporangium sp. NBC_01737]
MNFRFGLRERMAVSYVLVSAAAVLIVEAALLAVMIPRIRAAGDSVTEAQRREAATGSANLRLKSEVAASDVATAMSDAVTAMDAKAQGRFGAPELLSSAAAERYRARHDKPTGDGDAIEVVATTDGRVVHSNSTAFPADSRLPAEADGDAAVPRSGTADVTGMIVGWATRPVELTAASGTSRTVIGMVFVQTPPKSAGSGTPATSRIGAAVTSLQAALAVLVLLLPVGAVFGLLSTGRVIRRVHRLAAGATAMAGGDLRARIPVDGADELGQLEEAFNTLAQRLDAAVEVERSMAGAEARRAERTRITRELHDSISQDLFSASLLAGGLRRALPADSELRRQAEAMEASLGRTMREMRAMLLELRPVALEDAGLADALTELCRAYEARLGIAVTVHVDSVPLEPAVEHAVLRMVQEALGNAARHGDPGAVDLRVTAADGTVTVTVHDDGRGFDPADAGRRHGMGLGLMRDRVRELGGTLDVASAPQQGTTVTVLLPGGEG